MIQLDRIRVASFAVVAWAACAFVPWAPAFRPALAEQQYHWAFSRHWQLGRDIITNSGPLGFIGIPVYDPGTYPILIAAHIAMFFLAVRVLTACSEVLAGSRRYALLHAGVTLLSICLIPVSYWSPLLFLPYLLTLALVILHFHRTDSWEGPTKYALVASLGLLIWAKLNLAAVISVAVCAITMDEVFRLRRLPRAAACFASAIVVGWFLGRQGSDSLLPFVRYAGQYLQGYSSALGVWSTTSSALALLFAVAVVVVARGVYLACRVELGWRAWFVTVTWLTIGHGALWHGFIRADAEHISAAAVTLVSAMVLLGPWFRLKLVSARSRQWGGAVVGLACAFCSGYALVDGLAFGRLFWDGPRELVAFMRSGSNASHIPYLTESRKIHERTRTWRIAGSVEAPTGKAVSLVAGPALRPRPTLTSYVAYAPELIHLNEQYLRGRRAPQTVVFAPEPIDSNVATMMDSGSYLALLANYTLQSGDTSPLVFQRRPNPLRVTRVPLVRRDVGFGQAIDLSPFVKAPVWIRFGIRTNVLGTLLTKAYKPPRIDLEIAVNGQRIKRQLRIPAAAEGMLVSPFLETVEEFRRFYEAQGDLPALGGVTSVTICRGDHWYSWARTWFEERIQVEVEQVAVESQPQQERS